MEAQQISQPASDDLIITLFLAAMSCPEAERGQFVTEACSGDVVLLEEVERRVKWEARLNGFLLTPVLARDRFDLAFAPGDTVLRRFRILRVAGEGGMGVVYEAYDEKLGHRIALKCPRFEFRKRLSPEVMKSLRVTHPNVCRVFEIHTEETNTGEIDFLTMEFLEGQTLAERLGHAPAGWFGTPEGTEIARQLCTGLKAVHAEGIVHRDLKASNVMLTTGAAGGIRAVITDFGIAQGADLFSSQMRGTPAYLAPELWRGQPATIQSDLYALGVLFYEMACGRKPFPEGTNWKERLEAAPPQPDVGEPLRSALARCLHPDPRARFQNATEIEEALWGRRSRRWLLGAATGLAVSGGIGVFIKQRFWPTSTVRLAVLQPVINNEGVASAPTIKGFVLALSSRFKTIRGRRPVSVISPSETLAEGVKDPASAKAMFAATHTLSTEFQQNSSHWSISAALVETSTGKRLKSWNGSSARNDLALAAHMVALQSSIFEQTMQELMLRAEPKRQSLPPEVYADYIQGLYYVRDDEPKKARSYFERVIRAAPESALGHAGLAEALLEDRYKSGDKALEGKAVEAISKAEQLDPELAHVQLIAGRLFNASGQWEKAAACFQRAAELGPDDAQAFIQMGVAYFMLNKPHESAAAFQEAIKVQPHYYAPYDYAGWLEYEERNFAAAERHWLASVRIAPGKIRAREHLATLYIAKGRLEEAGKQIRETLDIQPTAQGALAAQADLYDRTGRHAAAIASYEQAMRAETKTYKIWAGLGGAYRRAGRETEAIGAFRKGLENSLEGVRTHQREGERVAWCAYYHAALGESDQARTCAGEAQSMNTPPQATLRKLLVLAYGQIGDIEAARRLLDGAPPDLLEEIARSPDLPAGLARDPRLERFTH